MADVLKETVQRVLGDDSESKNATEKIPSTPEGMFLAYSSLLFMALVPIYYGSFRSVRFLTEQKVHIFINYEICLLNVKQILSGFLQLLP